MLMFVDPLGRLQNPNTEETLQKFIMLGGEIRDITAKDRFILLSQGTEFMPVMGLIKGETVSADELELAERLGFTPVKPKGRYYKYNNAGNFQVALTNLSYSFNFSKLK